MELRGGDFDWDNWAGLPPAELAKQRASTAALLDSPESKIMQLLHGLQKLMHRPQEHGKGPKAEAASPRQATLTLQSLSCNPDLSASK